MHTCNFCKHVSIVKKMINVKKCDKAVTSSLLRQKHKLFALSNKYWSGKTFKITKTFKPMVSFGSEKFDQQIFFTVFLAELILIILKNISLLIFADQSNSNFCLFFCQRLVLNLFFMRSNPLRGERTHFVSHEPSLTWDLQHLAGNCRGRSP